MGIARSAPAGPKSGVVHPASGEAGGSMLARDLRIFATEMDYVYRTLRRYGVRGVDAEDLTQEVFLVAWRRRADFDGSRPLRPWLAGIAFNLAHQRRRRPGAQGREVLDEERAAAEPTYPTELEPESMDARALVMRGLAALPEHHRAVLILHDLDGVSVDTMAAQWSIPRFTLYTRLRRARQAFAKEIERLQARLPTGRLAGAMSLAPGPLLALERSGPPSPLPETVRDRLTQRLLGEAARAPRSGLPVPSAAGAEAHPGASGSGMLAASAGLAVLATAALVAVLVHARSAPPARSTARSPAAPASPKSAPPPRAMPRLAPALQAGAAGAPSPASGLDRDLVGFWRFDDGPGSTRAADQSAGGYHCDLHDLDPAQAWIPGARRGALDLGFQGWLECPQPDLPRRSNAALTVAMWVRRAGNPHMNHALAMRPADSGRQNYFHFGFSGDELRVSSSGWGGALGARFPREATGQWEHVAFTYDGEHAVKLFIGGLEVARRTATPRMFGAVHQPLRVGAGLVGEKRARSGQLFEGAIDELMVYERALSGDEIRSLTDGASPPGARSRP
jgi:RNA polymerase sigma-70 factor (ECF subfamily)